MFSKLEKQVLDEMKQTYRIYLECVQRIPNTDLEKEGKVQDLAIHLKCQLSELFTAYVNRYGNTMAGLDYYTSYYTLQTKIADLCEEF